MGLKDDQRKSFRESIESLKEKLVDVDNTSTLLEQQKEAFKLEMIQREKDLKESQGKRFRESIESIKRKLEDVDKASALLEQQKEAFKLEMIQKEKELKENQENRFRENIEAIKRKIEEVDRASVFLEQRQKEFDARIISYKELQDENLILKRDLHNIDVSLRKLQLDRDRQREKQEALDARAQELGARYLKENIKWLGNSLNSNNFAASKQKLLDVIDRCRKIGFAVSPEEESAYLADLKKEYERIVRLAFEREEQARIKTQIREEQKLQREIEQEMKRLDREKALIQAALDKALTQAQDLHSQEIQLLQARLAEAEEKARRAQSQAQLTKAGHVYVISNIGSFGEGVYKIGMTRRLEPEMRIRELGDASVPFPFDIHS